jgi:hypothetical protein
MKDNLNLLALAFPELGTAQPQLVMVIVISDSSSTEYIIHQNDSYFVHT